MTTATSKLSLGCILPYDVCTCIDYYKTIQESIDQTKKIYIPWNCTIEEHISLHGGKRKNSYKQSRTLEVKSRTQTLEFDKNYINEIGPDYIELYAYNDIDLYCDDYTIKYNSGQHKRLIYNFHLTKQQKEYTFIKPENIDWKFYGTVKVNHETDTVQLTNTYTKTWCTGECGIEDVIVFSLYTTVLSESDLFPETPHEDLMEHAP